MKFPEACVHFATRGLREHISVSQPAAVSPTCQRITMIDTLHHRTNTPQHIHADVHYGTAYNMEPRAYTTHMCTSVCLRNAAAAIPEVAWFEGVGSAVWCNPEFLVW